METSNEMLILLTATVLTCALLFADPVPAWSQSVQSFSDLYEPSGVAYLSDGRVVVVEDDGDRPIRLFSTALDNGALVLTPEKLKGGFPNVDDLEGVSVGKNDKVFLITSHSQTKKGKRSELREQLIALTIHAGQNVTVESFGNLMPYVQSRLKDSLKLKDKQLDDINIEGLAFDATKEILFIGLRSPAYKKKAIILSLLNPYDLFNKKQNPVFDDEIILLDLEGAGIRAIIYDKKNNRYLLAGEAENKKGKLRSRIWAWDGQPNGKVSRLQVSQIKGAKNIEGLTIVQHQGSPVLLFVCDNGEKKNKEGGSYGFIDLKEL